ncbi:hypothetical protein EV191_12835 [Tamaricihabitans halophyticus]|uniref:Uncharacterized protein n=2 Tax=Tamaricihabitans halophyticus TaxID=1262583 RepID=A0A4R2Q2C5_9PSEU|nr:hypothetical protein EV191_12835 [Tamaricihabitans halophyticus]
MVLLVHVIAAGVLLVTAVSSGSVLAWMAAGFAVLAAVAQFLLALSKPRSRSAKSVTTERRVLVTVVRPKR